MTIAQVLDETTGKLVEAGVDVKRANFAVWGMALKLGAINGTVTKTSADIAYTFVFPDGSKGMYQRGVE